MGALSRLQKQVREVLSPYDLMIVLGADPLRMSVYSEVDPLPEGMPIVQIGLVDWDLAKNYGAEIALKADVKETLRVLVPALKAAGGAALETRAKQGIAALASRRTGRRGARTLIEQISKAKDRSPIDPDYLALQVVEAMPDNAILVDEGLTSSRQMLALRPHRDRYGYHALASGGIGWGLPASVGVSLANPDRPVVCYSGDGSAMYSIQALWTAAHHKLPLTVVIVNNGGYRIIKQRLLAFHGDDHYVGMDFVDPPVDFTGMAKSLGLEAMRITEAEGFEAGAVVGVQAARREADRGGGRRDGVESSLRSAAKQSMRMRARWIARRFAPRNDGQGELLRRLRRHAADTARPDAARRAARGRRRTVFRAAFPAGRRSCSARAAPVPAPACRRYPRNRRAKPRRGR